MEPRILWIAADPAEKRPQVPGTCLAADAATPETAAQQLSTADYDVAVLAPPFASGAEEILHQLRQLDPELPVLIHDPAATAAQAVRLARLGAHEFLAAGAAAGRQIAQAADGRRTRALAALANSVLEAGGERRLVGLSREMRQVAEVIRMVGPRRATVLITGETGTGKEIAARALHLAGPRGSGPFVAVNCSALPETLLEAELFGHVRGAFTGALQSRAGRFEQAHGGTLFLDEIGDMPAELQAKLLRVLQEREIQRLGSSETVRIDVRVVAATNRDLAERMRAGRFREDLYYRLNVVPLELPPLRQRRGDIPLLAAHFLEQICRREHLPLRRLLPETLDRLCAGAWPGNVRELENSLEKAVTLSGERTILVPADFSLSCHPPLPQPAGELSITLPPGGLDYEATLRSIERGILDQALERTGGNKKAAADLLRLKRTTLAAKLRSLETADAAVGSH